MVVYSPHMGEIFAVLLLISLACFVWGLISPEHLANKTKIKRPLTRKHTSLGFGIVAVILVGLIGLTSPKTVILNTANAAAHKPAPPRPASASKPTDNITTKQVVETQAIPFTSTNEDDNSLAKGQTHIKQAGQNGVETLTYNVVYSNGNQTSKNLVSQAATTQPINQILEIGTYVAPVPVAASSAPAPPPAAAPAPASSASCTPLSNEGNCYEPGEYCRDSDHGSSGVAGNGESISCEDNDGWRWEP
jgi:hypothetical protein